MARGGNQGVSIGIIIVLTLLLIGVGASLGYMWWQERGDRVQAEQATQTLQGKYDSLKLECDAMKYGGEQSLSLSQSDHSPIITKLEIQTDTPRCERPNLQPFTEALRKQDAKFFENTKEGDILVMYPQNKKVYVYRQTTSEIIAEATIYDENAKTNQQSSPGLSLQGVTPSRVVDN